MTYDLFAILRDGFAIILLLNAFPVVVLAFAGRDLSSHTLVRIAGLLVLSALGLILTNNQGLFPNRMPALILVGMTIVI